MSLFAAGAVVFVLFVASYSQRGSWLALCSMSMSIASVFGYFFVSTAHDHNQIRMTFAWAASKLPLVVDRQTAHDFAPGLEDLATSPRCDIACNAATNAALLPKKDVENQLAIVGGSTKSKPDPEAMPIASRQAVEDRDYLIRTIAFEASGEPTMAKIAVA